MKRLLHLAPLATLILAFAASPLQAQDDPQAIRPDSTLAPLWQNMRDGGLISDLDYQHALQYGALPARVNVDRPHTFQAAAAAARRSQEATWARNRDKHRKSLHRGLDLDNGRILSFPALKEKKRADLRARAAEIGARQRQEKQDAEAWARRNNIDIRFNLPHGGASELMSIRGGIPRFYTTCNYSAARTVSTGHLWPGGSTGLRLTGAGTTIGIWDEADVLLTHQEFDTPSGTRVKDRDGTSESGVSEHTTHVAGTLIAQGLKLAARGMSYQANLDAYDWTGDIGEMGHAADRHDLLISNHSYSTPAGWGKFSYQGKTYDIWRGDTFFSRVESFWFGFYDDVSRDIDATVYDATFYLPVWSASNERGRSGEAPHNDPVDHYSYHDGQWIHVTDHEPPDDGYPDGFDTLHFEGVAKNVLTIGSAHDIFAGYQVPADVVLSYFSSLGPTDDGRIKPDLLGNGQALYSTVSTADDDYDTYSGTSMAAPNVTGSLNLLLQRHAQLAGPQNPMWASTLKALALHTADEAGAFPGPDYMHGWGLLNTRKAVELIDANFNTESLAHIKQVVLMNGELIEFLVVSDGSEPLRVTICWTDPAGQPLAPALDPPDLMLVNDLDLRIVRHTTTHRPWTLDPDNPDAAATTGDNFRDNVEQVLIPNPTPAQYLVRVTHKNDLVDDTGAVSLQHVSIAVSGNVPQPLPTLEIVSADMTGPDEITLAWTAVLCRTYQVQYTADMDAPNWLNTGPEINATRYLVAVAVSAPSAEQQRFYRIKEII